MSTNRFGQNNVLFFSQEFSSRSVAATENTADDHENIVCEKYPQVPRKINPMWLVERLFGERHWACQWVIELCEADPQFLLHLVDQPPEYVHFICLVRLAAVKQFAEGGDNLEWATFIRTQNKKSVMEKLYPGFSAGVLKVLPKLQKKPMGKKCYQNLIDAFADDRTRKRLHHAKRVRKFDLEVFHLIKDIPEKFQSSGIIASVKTHCDLEYLNILILVSQYLNLEMPEQEIDDETSELKSMPKVEAWFKRKIEKAPFPPPPWEGNDWIKPVKSREELKAVGGRFKNCVGNYCIKALLGYSYFYVCEQTPAVIEIRKDAVFGWEVLEMKKVSNRKLTHAERDEIIQSFSEAGFGLHPPSCGPGGENYGEVLFEYEQFSLLRGDEFCR